MTKKQRALTEARIRYAMAALVGHPEFSTFIDLIREYRETAVQDACSDRVLASERLSMAAAGEVRAYTAIVSAYDQALLNKAETDPEAAAGPG
jgi:hypothetical protein